MVSMLSQLNANQGRVADEVDPRVEEAKRRLLGLYEVLGTWRAVQQKRGLPNVSYLYYFVVHGVIPGNPGIRRKLYLPKTLRKRSPAAPAPEWLAWWRRLTAEEREAAIKGLFEERGE
jgi:hypothetical protein